MYTESYIESMRQALTDAADNWHCHAIDRVELLTMSENATFKAIYQDGKRMILRVNRANYHTIDELKSEVEWLSALSQHNAVSTPAIISNHQGEKLSAITVQSEGEDKQLWVTAFEFCKGSEPSISDDLSPWFEKLGELTARLHQHTRSWIKPQGFVRKQWTLQTMVGTDGYWGDWRKTPDLTDLDRLTINAALEKVEQRLQQYHSTEKYGLVHADLRLANLIIDGDDLQLIDFDDCGYCWYMYDFAASISFYELDPSIPELQKAWIAGYNRITPLSQQDIDEMNTFILLRRVLLTAWLTTHSDTPTAEALAEGFARGTVELAVKYLDSFSYGEEVYNVA